MSIDEKKLFDRIRSINPKTILLRGPEGYLNLIQRIASKIEGQFNIPTIISADECYGSCDTIENDALILGAEIVLHVGHSIRTDNFGKRTIMIDVTDDISFSRIIKKSIPIIKKYKRLGLCTISQYLNALQPSKKLFEEYGFDVIIGQGQGYLRDGQIFGCRFNTVFSIKGRIDAIIFLGQSRFHALGASLSTSLPTFMLDPYSNTFENMQNETEKWYKRAILQIYKAIDAKKFGVLIGLKEGQMNINTALRIRERLINNGKNAQLFSIREISSNRLDMLSQFDAFIQTACPRISIDQRSFKKPVLSTLQTEALFGIWDGLDPKSVLEKETWF